MEKTDWLLLIATLAGRAVQLLLGALLLLGLFFVG